MPDVAALNSAYATFHDRITGGKGADESPPVASYTERACLHLAWRLDRSASRIFDRVTALAGGRTLDVCDIGCASGVLLGQLRQAGHRVAGVEPSPEACERAIAAGLDVCHGTAEEMPEGLQQGRFDIVVIHHVLEHCPQPLLALENARRLLKRGGIVIVDVPNCACRELGSVGIAWFHLDVPRHVNFFTEISLTSALAVRRKSPLDGLS